MEIMDKVVGVEPEVETDLMEKVNQKLDEAGRHLVALGLSKAVEAISLWSRTVLAPALKRVGQEWQKMYELMERNRVGKEEELDLMKKARIYGLNERVISLCGHRKERVRKKNLNRLKKEVLRYERSRRNTRGQETGKPPEGNV